MSDTLFDLPPAQPPHDDVELSPEAGALQPGAAPWKRDVMDNVGENWLIAELGYSEEAGTCVILTTDHVRASEDYGDPFTDAEWMAWCRNHWDEILEALDLRDRTIAQMRIEAWNQAARS